MYPLFLKEFLLANNENDLWDKVRDHLPKNSYSNFS